MENKTNKPESWVSAAKGLWGDIKDNVETLTKEGRKQLNEFQQREDIRRLAEEAQRLANDMTEKGRKRLEDFRQREDVQNALAEAQRLSDEYGVSDFKRKVFGAAGETIDSLSGRDLLEKVQQIMAEQQRYNDVLATKLTEALARIEALERALARQGKS